MWIWESLKSKQHSLAQQYLYFTVAVISLILIITIWISFSTYHSYREDKRIFLEKEGQKLVGDFDDKLKIIEHLMQFLGTKVRTNTDLSDKSIVELVHHHQDNFKDDSFAWHAIHFARPDGTLIADSVSGFVKPIKLSTEKRSWIEKSRNLPWTIQFSKPDIGLSSGDYILPSAVGLYDNDRDKFIGYLSAGISIEKLTTRLLQASNDQISFVILDDDLNFITSSEPILNDANFILSDQIKDILENDHDKDVNELPKAVDAEQYIYTHLTHSSSYPFSIFIGQNKHLYYQELKEELLPKVIMYIALGVIFTSILLFLGYQVIKPIIELGQAADNISRGKNVRVPTYKAKELNTLSLQLADIANITKDLRTKQLLLGKANQNLEQANAFIKSNMSFLSHELINPISSIIGFAQLLAKKVDKYKDEELKEFADIIHKTSIYQNKQLNFFLRLFKFQEARKHVEDKQLDIKELLEWNISMIKHHARSKNVTIDLKVEPNLKILGDEMMLGQLIQNIASNAAKYNKQDGNITISASKNSKDQIVLQFTDTGIGIAKSDLDKIFKKFTRLKNKETSRAIGYGIGLAYAKECALAHEGNITVKSIPEKGTTFTVTFPSYRTLEE